MTTRGTINKLLRITKTMLPDISRQELLMSVATDDVALFVCMKTKLRRQLLGKFPISAADKHQMDLFRGIAK